MSFDSEEMLRKIMELESATEDDSPGDKEAIAVLSGAVETLDAILEMEDTSKGLGYLYIMIQLRAALHSSMGPEDTGYFNSQAIILGIDIELLGFAKFDPSDEESEAKELTDQLIDRWGAVIARMYDKFHFELGMNPDDSVKFILKCLGTS